jgi:hypothetical protein
MAENQRTTQPEKTKPETTPFESGYPACKLQYLMDLDDFARLGLAPVYGLEGCPGWPRGSLLVAQEQTWEDIQDNDQVAYREPQGAVHTGCISFTESNIILHGQPGIPDKVLPRDEIQRCDRIRGADFRDDALKLQMAELKMFLKNFLGDDYPLP